MATVKAYTSLNMVNPSTWWGWVWEATPNYVTITDGKQSSVYSGYGFQYSADSVVAGTMTSYAHYSNTGALMGEAYGFAVPAPMAAQYVLSNNLLALFSTILAGPDYIQGSTYNDSLHGYGGNDILYGNGGQNYIHGGDGIDVAMYTAPRSSFNISPFTTSIGVVAKNGSSRDTLVSVERIAFSDGTLAYDDISAQAYRLYQAAFARTPDQNGLSHWVASMDDGNSLTNVAASFIASAEFQSKYGAPDPAGFVSLLYQNVLGRGADEGGYSYWLGRFEAGLSREAALMEFSESGENKANVASEISGGIWLNWDVFV